MRRYGQSLILPILAGLLVASVGLAQTVRLQDATAPNLATVDSTGAVKVNQAGNTTGSQPATAPASLTRSIPNLYCEQVVAISQVFNTQLIPGIANQQVYICGLAIVSNGQQLVSLVEGGGVTCGANTKALFGNTSAATLFTTGGSLSLVSGVPWLRTITPGNNVCLLQNLLLGLTGVITFHQE